MQVEQSVKDAVRRKHRVIHISSHSFTPELDGEVRNADVGLLYDPRRAGEAALCASWQAAMALRFPQIRVRRNYPYEGKGDGLTSHLRRCYSPESYIGVELEVNQAIVFAGGRDWSALRNALVETLRAAAGSFIAKTSVRAR